MYQANGRMDQVRSAAETPMSEARLRQRAPRVDPDSGSLPRHWYARSAVATHFANAVNLLFPSGERFLARTMIVAERPHGGVGGRVAGFCGQESLHAAAHQRMFRVLREQGFDVDGFVAAYEWLISWMLEPHLPLPLKLAIAAAAEHLIAVLAAHALAHEDALARDMHPRMFELFIWHAAEEVEHKDVAFAVLARESPGYLLRAVGMVALVPAVAALWGAGAVMLLAQDDVVSWRAVAEELFDLRLPLRDAGTALLGGIGRYLRPGFFPEDGDDRASAARCLERLEASGAVWSG